MGGRSGRGAPLPIKIMWYATRGRHARLTRRALGDAVDVVMPATA